MVGSHDQLRYTNIQARSEAAYATMITKSGMDTNIYPSHQTDNAGYPVANDEYLNALTVQRGDDLNYMAPYVEMSALTKIPVTQWKKGPNSEDTTVGIDTCGMEDDYLEPGGDNEQIYDTIKDY